jgi:hypothetical protein
VRQAGDADSVRNSAENRSSTLRGALLRELSKVERRTPMTRTALCPEIQAFAIEMQKKLDENAGKGHWGNCELGYLKRRLRTEMKELFAALDKVRDYAPAEDEGHDPLELRESKLRAAVVREAADVANFAMMMADNVGRMQS